MQGGAHHKHARPREVAIHISDITLRKEDRGAVVIGGSIEMGDLKGMLHASTHSCVKAHARQTKQPQLGMYWSHQLSLTSSILIVDDASLYNSSKTCS